jgi:hypothetical protein
MVVQGFAREERAAQSFVGSAADYLLARLRASGALDEKKRRVVCEASCFVLFFVLFCFVFVLYCIVLFCFYC